MPSGLPKALDVRASGLIRAERSSSVVSLAWIYEGSEAGHVPNLSFWVSSV